MTETTDDADKSYPTEWYGIKFDDEQMAILKGPAGIKGVTTLILENGFRARQAKNAGDLTEMHQHWMHQCTALLIAAREYPTLVGDHCDPAALAMHTGDQVEAA